MMLWLSAFGVAHSALIRYGVRCDQSMSSLCHFCDHRLDQRHTYLVSEVSYSFDDSALKLRVAVNATTRLWALPQMFCG